MTAAPLPALVFGGSRGIGAATVRALAAAGHPTAYTARNSTEDGIAGAACIPCDITRAEAVETAFATATDRIGRPGIVIANAGINVPPAPIANFPTDRFADLMAVNLTGAFHVLSAAARHVPDGGRIVALTTALVRHPVPGAGPYIASKAAVEALLRSMQKELAPRGIRVNGVAPGPVDTDLFRAGKDAAALDRSANMSPFARVGTPDEVASVIAFLVSDTASWVAGQIVQPNGALV